MNVFVIVFMIVAGVFALGTIGYVSVDAVIEAYNRRDEGREPVLVPVAPAPVAEAPAQTVPKIVEHINAEKADSMISNALAIKNANYESGAGNGQQGIVNVGVLCDHFEANDEITLARLKEKGLVPKKAGRIKVLADGVVNKPLTVKAESYSIQAIKMIELTGGTVIVLKD